APPPTLFPYTTLFRSGSLPGLLRTLRAVLGARLLALIHSRGVERAADDMVADARQVLHAAAADHHDRVLLQVMPLTRDVRRHFRSEEHTSELQSRFDL